MLLFFYSLALAAVLVAGLPYWLIRMAGGRYREGLGERLGRVPARLKRRPGVLWVHAVSVGEVLAAGRLVEELGRAAGRTVVVSTTTRTGQKLARERFGADRVFYFPLDFGFVVRRYLRALRPAMLVLIESEFWPNVLGECRRAGIPVAVVNGRVSDRSLRRSASIRWLWKPVFEGLSLALAQSAEDARRMAAIGIPADRVQTGGNLKFDIRAAGAAPVTRALRANLPPDARVLVCGSTLEGEEEMLLGACAHLRRSVPEMILILAPRHPERFSRVAALLRAREKALVRRSRWMKKPSRIAPGTVFLLDSMGELSSVYSLASVAFVGGSLVPAGGHNPLEPAQFGVPVVMGQHYENFRAIVGTLLHAEAIKIATPATLAPMLALLLEDRATADALGVRALEVCNSESGATERAVKALLGLLPAATRAGEGKVRV